MWSQIGGKIKTTTVGSSASKDFVGVTIKVISTDGKLVSEFAAQGGGRAFWDGHDKNGQIVPSGIYFIVAFAENGNQTTAAKVAVIRR